MGAQFGAAALPLGLPSLGPFLRAEFGLSLFWLGALLVAPTAGLAAASYWWGSASDRWGERRVIVTGMAGAAAVELGAMAAGRAWAFGGLLVLAGAAGAAAPAASGKAVVAWFPPGERGLALSLRHTAPMIGGACAAAVLPLAATQWGLRGALAALVSFALGGALIALLISPAPAWDGRADAPAAPTLARSPAFWTMVLAGSLVAVGQGILTRFLPEYLHAERGWTQAAAGAALSATLVLAAVLRVGAGIASDRHGRRAVTLRNQAALAGVGAVAFAFQHLLPVAIGAIRCHAQ